MLRMPATGKRAAPIPPPKEKEASRSLEASFRVGADDRNRTGDLLVTSELLYQLSYIGVASVSFLKRLQL